jgi:hypothetical protein
LFLMQAYVKQKLSGSSFVGSSSSGNSTHFNLSRLTVIETQILHWSGFDAHVPAFFKVKYILGLASFCCGNTKKQKKTRLLRDKAPRNDNSTNVRRHCEESSTKQSRLFFCILLLPQQKLASRRCLEEVAECYFSLALQV